MYVLTGSRGKFEEIRAVLPAAKQLDIDLPEIQELDPHGIIRTRLEEAMKHTQGEFIVEGSLSGDKLKRYESFLKEHGC